MMFHQFLLLVLSVYSCYYLLLVLYDRMSYKQALVNTGDVTEFVVAPQIIPVKVRSTSCRLEQEPEDDAVYQQEGEPEHEDREDAVTQSVSNDLRLEVISAPSALLVSSKKFADWFKNINKLAMI